MKKLESMIKELEEILQNNSHKNDVIIQLLQKIGAELLTNYEIRVNDLTIELLRVEPYLYQEGSFEDKFIHLEDDVYGKHQRNRRGKLYIHKGFSGVDIVLSTDDRYAFSFLIKNSRALINNQIVVPFLKQYGIAEILKKHGIPLDYNECVLYQKEKPIDCIVFKTVRNGLSKIAERSDFTKQEQAKYSHLLISSFIELKEHTSRQYNFETGYGGDKAVVIYLKEYKVLHPEVSIAELDEMRKKVYPNCSKTEYKKEFGE